MISYETCYICRRLRPVQQTTEICTDETVCGIVVCHKCIDELNNIRSEQALEFLQERRNERV
jgi:hypothetical protein